LEHLLEGANGIEALRATCKIRQHGDYHLGQVLESPEGGFVIIDFEGEPSKPLAIRREKRSSLRDVAGMLRSFDYARNAALRAQGGGDTARAARWYEAVRNAFLDSYVQTVRRRAPELLPMDIEPPLRALELEKAAYEVLYELNNRPDWLPIPLAALTSGAMPPTAWPGRPDPLGAPWDGRGTNSALCAHPATRVELCLFDDTAGKETARIVLPDQTRN